MNGMTQVLSGGPPSVAFIITHTIKAGYEAEYEVWVSEIFHAVSAYPGYLGREVFRPVFGKREYTSIVRFDSPDNLDAWIDSDTRKSFIDRAAHMLERGDVHEIRTGIDFWFTPPHTKPPKPWKQFLLTVSAVYPLTILIPFVLSPLFERMPLTQNHYVRGLCVAIALTGSLTFFVMPRYTRLMSRWLYEDME